KTDLAKHRRMLSSGRRCVVRENVFVIFGRLAAGETTFRAAPRSRLNSGKSEFRCDPGRAGTASPPKRDGIGSRACPTSTLVSRIGSSPYFAARLGSELRIRRTLANLRF